MVLIVLLALALGGWAPARPDCADTVPTMERTFEVFADYHQFVVADAGSDLRGLEDAWTGEAIARGHVGGRDYVGVGTARAVEVPVTVRVLAAEPGPAGADWQRVGETGLEVPSGELLVAAVTAAQGDGERFSLTPGRYRARVLATGLDTLSPNGLSGADRYAVELWPG
jgi:hypothetical protein